MVTFPDISDLKSIMVEFKCDQCNLLFPDTIELLLHVETNNCDVHLDNSNFKTHKDINTGGIS